MFYLLSSTSHYIIGNLYHRYRPTDEIHVLLGLSNQEDGVGGARGRDGRDEKRNPYKILVGNLKGRDHMEDLDVYERIKKGILGKLGGSVWTEFVWLRIWTAGGFL
jgi:hypothetical protein